MIYAYARVSSKDQNLERQLKAFREAGVLDENIYMDKQSGKDFNRPGYQQLIKQLKKDDLILIKSIDRLGRNYEEIIEQWRLITKTIGADVKILDMPLLDTTYGKDFIGTFVADIVLQILSFQAEQERNYIKTRQAEGIAAAREQGIKFGRSRKPFPENFDELYERWQNGEAVNKLAKEQNEISASTLRLRFKERAWAEENNDNI